MSFVSGKLSPATVQQPVTCMAAVDGHRLVCPALVDSEVGEQIRAVQPSKLICGEDNWPVPVLAI